MTMRVTDEMLEAAQGGLDATVGLPWQKRMRAALEAALALPQPAVAKADEERAREIALCPDFTPEERAVEIAHEFAAVRAEQREADAADCGARAAKIMRKAELAHKRERYDEYERLEGEAQLLGVQAAAIRQVRP